MPFTQRTDLAYRALLPDLDIVLRRERKAVTRIGAFRVYCVYTDAYVLCMKKKVQTSISHIWDSPSDMISPRVAGLVLMAVGMAGMGVVASQAQQGHEAAQLKAVSTVEPSDLPMPAAAPLPAEREVRLVYISVLK